MIFNEQLLVKKRAKPNGKLYLVWVKIKKFFKSILSFLILAAYTIVASGIFYGVEKNICAESYRVAPRNQTPTQGIENFWQALHFIATLETTIGYGDITPCTIWGQLLAILFALIGIPLFLVSLTHLGKWLEDALNALYLWLKGLLKKKQKNRTFDKKKLNEINDIDFVPLSVGLGVTLLWTIFASIYFYFILQQYYNDNFNFFTAIYFTLVSFLTIGLGEISPVNYQLTLITSIFIVMGLALVTMCIEIAQTKLEIILHNMKLLIEKEFKNNLAFGKIPSNDSKAAKNLLKKLFQEEPNAKYFSLFISDRDKNQLIESYRSLSNQVSKSVQTENKRTADNSTNTIQVEDKPEEEEEPKRLIIRYTKKHPNKIGYKT